METFVKPLLKLGAFQEMTDTIEKERGLVTVTGCIDAQKPHMAYAVGMQKNKLIVTFQEKKAKELYEDYRFFDSDVVYYPAKDVLFYSRISGEMY